MVSLDSFSVSSSEISSAGNVPFFDQMVRNYLNGARFVYNEGLNMRSVILGLIP